MTTMADEQEHTEYGRRYEGWASRETWAAQLWLANDEGTYLMASEWAKQAIREAEGDEERYEWLTVDQAATSTLEDSLREWLEEIADQVYEGQASDEATTMVRDIGSTWRIDWREIAEHWVRDAREEMGQEADQ